MTGFKPVLAALASALLVSACGPGAAPSEGSDTIIPAPAFPVVLAVTGAHGRDSVDGGLFERFGIAGDAHSFTFADIALLTHHEITAGYPQDEAARTWRGVRLSDVLSAAGGDDSASARITCLDGYTVEVEAGMIAAHEPILAHSVDGRALTLGELGPFLLVWPRDTAPDLSDMNDDLWAWGVFAIEAM
ncbi:MAG: hypothetical protein ACXIVL_10540 [Oceanicaulis sp.]